MKYKQILFILICSCCIQGVAQAKYEREHRIKKSQFPEEAHALLANEITKVKRLRFYKETDSAKTRFEAKFKKDRLHYSMEFDSDGILEDVEILIKEIDIPNDTFTSIESYLNQSYSKYHIRKIQQLYPVKNREEVKKTLKEAFQNLLLPSVNYKLLVSCKTEDGKMDFEFLFDSAGTFKKKRALLPPNYDHVLY
ncbi:hypothetical protein [uncultured Muriicola sp.]|uniref:hypothetical protein n=1 Tax=uncultured Muriicola sp. TaxID=1583102 RepID=UPI002607A392|nr:hypothetical protein [uncultured Muriicola sp.]